MSDTTPRPDETPSDPTAPPPPADTSASDASPAPEAPAAETTEVPAVAETREVSAAPPAPAAASAEVPPPPPAEPYAVPAQQPYPPQYAQQPPAYQQPYGQQGYAQQPPQYAPAAPQPLTPNEERTWGMLSHVVGGAAMVLSGGFLGFVGSLVIYLMYKDRGPFVRAHAANSLNVQITAAIGFLIGWVLAIVLVGFAILAVVFVWAVVMHIIGAVKANNGEWWTPPLTPQFIK